MYLLKVVDLIDETTLTLKMPFLELR